MKNLSLASVFLTIIFLAGCNNNKSREKPDVSNLNFNLHIERFDKDLFEFNENNFWEHEQVMEKKYGPFYKFYVGQFITGPRQPGDTSDIAKQAILQFVSDGYIKRLQDSINLHFDKMEEVDGELTLAMKYFKHYFPDIAIPRALAVNSGFSLGAFTYGNDILGIGLDLYLGDDNPDYDSAGIYSYVQHKMSKEFIARNSVEVLYNFYFDKGGDSPDQSLIEAMVSKGKKMYFLSYMIPDAPDSLIVGFTSNQTEWCEKSENEIWKFLNDKDLLYNSDYMNRKRYLDDGPTTTGMPPESPGSIGNWIGLQIVRKFMSETGNKISLRDLILKYDEKTIFEEARYRPSKKVF